MSIGKLPPVAGVVSGGVRAGQLERQKAAKSAVKIETKPTSSTKPDLNKVVELGDGSYVDKESFEKLPQDSQEIGKTKGLSALQADLKQKQIDFEAANVKIAGDTYISKESFESLSPELQEVAKTQGLDAVKSQIDTAIKKVEPYKEGENIKVVQFLQENPQDVQTLKTLGISEESIGKAAKFAEGLNLVKPYTKEDKIDLVGAIRGGVDTAKLVESGLISQADVNAAKDYIANPYTTVTTTVPATKPDGTPLYTIDPPTPEQAREIKEAMARGETDLEKIAISQGRVRVQGRVVTETVAKEAPLVISKEDTSIYVAAPTKEQAQSIKAAMALGLSPFEVALAQGRVEASQPSKDLPAGFILGVEKDKVRVNTSEGKAVEVSVKDWERIAELEGMKQTDELVSLGVLTDVVKMSDGSYLSRQYYNTLTPELQKYAYDRGVDGLQIQIDQIKKARSIAEPILLEQQREASAFVEMMGLLKDQQKPMIAQNKRQQDAFKSLEDYKQTELMVGPILEPESERPIITQYKIGDYLLDNNNSQEAKQVLINANFPQDAIDNASIEVQKVLDAKSDIEKQLSGKKELSGEILAINDAIYKAGYYDPYKLDVSWKQIGALNPNIQWIDNKTGKILTDKEMAKKQWEILTESQKKEVADIYNADLYKSSYFAEYTKQMGEISEKGGIVGSIVYSPILGITSPIAKKVTGQEVTPMEIAGGVATGVSDVLMLGGGQVLGGALGVGTKAITWGEAGLWGGVGVVSTTNTVQNANKMSKGELAVSVVFDVLAFLPLGLKGAGALKTGISEAKQQRAIFDKTIETNGNFISDKLISNPVEAQKAKLAYQDMTTKIKTYGDTLVELKQAQKVVSDVGFAKTKAELDLINQANAKIKTIETKMPELQDSMSQSIKKYNDIMVKNIKVDDPSVTRSMNEMPYQVRQDINAIAEKIVNPRKFENIMNDIVRVDEEMQVTNNALQENKPVVMFPKESALDKANKSLDKINQATDSLMSGKASDSFKATVQNSLNTARQESEKIYNSSVNKVNDVAEKINVVADRLMSGESGAEITGKVRTYLTEAKQVMVGMKEAASKGYEAGVVKLNDALESVNTLAGKVMSGESGRVITGNLKQLTVNLKGDLTSIKKNIGIGYEKSLDALNRKLDSINGIADGMMAGKYNDATRMRLQKLLREVRDDLKYLKTSINTRYEKGIQKLNDGLDKINQLSGKVMSGEIGSQVTNSLKEVGISLKDSFNKTRKFIVKHNEIGIQKINNSLENINVAADRLMALDVNQTAIRQLNDIKAWNKEAIDFYTQNPDIERQPLKITAGELQTTLSDLRLQHNRLMSEAIGTKYSGETIQKYIESDRAEIKRINDEINKLPENSPKRKALEKDLSDVWKRSKAMGELVAFQNIQKYTEPIVGRESYNNIYERLKGVYDKLDSSKKVSKVVIEDFDTVQTDIMKALSDGNRLELQQAFEKLKLKAQDLPFELRDDINKRLEKIQKEAEQNITQQESSTDIIEKLNYRINDNQREIDYAKEFKERHPDHPKTSIINERIEVLQKQLQERKQELRLAEQQKLKKPLEKFITPEEAEKLGKPAIREESTSLSKKRLERRIEKATKEVAQKETADISGMLIPRTYESTSITSDEVIINSPKRGIERVNITEFYNKPQDDLRNRYGDEVQVVDAVASYTIEGNKIKLIRENQLVDVPFIDTGELTENITRTITLPEPSVEVFPDLELETETEIQPELKPQTQVETKVQEDLKSKYLKESKAGKKPPKLPIPSKDKEKWDESIPIPPSTITTRLGAPKGSKKPEGRWVLIPPPYEKVYYMDRLPEGAELKSTGRWSSYKNLQIINNTNNLQDFDAINKDIGISILHIYKGESGKVAVDFYRDETETYKGKNDRDVDYESLYNKMVNVAKEKGYNVVYVSHNALKDYQAMNPEVAPKIGYEMPDNEIQLNEKWNDNYKDKYESLKHELDEIEDMKQGKTYWEAHNDALKSEKEVTTETETIQPYEGRSFNMSLSANTKEELEDTIANLKSDMEKRGFETFEVIEMHKQSDGIGWTATVYAHNFNPINFIKMAARAGAKDITLRNIFNIKGLTAAKKVAKKEVRESEIAKATAVKEIKEAEVAQEEVQEKKEENAPEIEVKEAEIKAEKETKESDEAREKAIKEEGEAVEASEALQKIEAEVIKKEQEVEKPVEKPIVSQEMVVEPEPVEIKQVVDPSIVEKEPETKEEIKPYNPVDIDTSKVELPKEIPEVEEIKPEEAKPEETTIPMEVDLKKLGLKSQPTIEEVEREEAEEQANLESLGEVSEKLEEPEPEIEPELFEEEQPKLNTYDEVRDNLSKAKAELNATNQAIEDSRVGDLTYLVRSRGKDYGNLPDITVNQYRELFRKEPSSNILNERGRVKWEYSLDQLASERGYEDAESLRDAILRTKQLQDNAASIGDSIKVLSATEDQLRSQLNIETRKEYGELSKTYAPEEIEPEVVVGQQPRTEEQQKEMDIFYAKENIAEKIVNNQELTPEEKEIYNNNTDEINHSIESIRIGREKSVSEKEIVESKSDIIKLVMENPELLKDSNIKALLGEDYDRVVTEINAQKETESEVEESPERVIALSKDYKSLTDADKALLKPNEYKQKRIDYIIVLLNNNMPLLEDDYNFILRQRGTTALEQDQYDKLKIKARSLKVAEEKRLKDLQNYGFTGMKNQLLKTKIKIYPEGTKGIEKEFSGVLPTIKTDHSSEIALGKERASNFDYGKYQVYLVNGNYIKKNLFPAFSGSISSITNPEVVPGRQIWIAKDETGLPNKREILKQIAIIRNLKSGNPKDRSIIMANQQVNSLTEDGVSQKLMEINNEINDLLDIDNNDDGFSIVDRVKSVRSLSSRKSDYDDELTKPNRNEKPWWEDTDKDYKKVKQKETGLSTMDGSFYRGRRLLPPTIGGNL